MLPNQDPETGIRYGIICANRLSGEVLGDFEPVYPDPADMAEFKCPECDAIADSAVPLTAEWGDSVRCPNCEEEFDLEMPDMLEPCCVEYDADGYQLRLDDRNDVWVFKSPYTAERGLCSPCCPNAGHLETKGGYLTYALGPEWFDKPEDMPYELHEEYEGCPHCGRDNTGYGNEPCSDDCPGESAMNVYELEKQAVPAPWTADSDMISIEDQAHMLLDAVSTPREWQAIGISDSEGLAEVTALCHPMHAKLLVHCRNNFVRAVEALKQISKETVNGQQSLAASVALGILPELEEVK